MSDDSTINHVVVIGLLGGGQLGKMMAAEAHKLGFKVVVIDPTEDCPCHGLVDRHIVGDFKDYQQVLSLQNQGCDVVTVEIEHVNVESLEGLVKAGVKVQPTPNTIRIIQDKLLQKQYLKKHNVAVGPFTDVNTKDDLLTAINLYKLPVVLKTRKLAYDGRGNYVIRSLEEVDTAWNKLGGTFLYVEQWVDFEKELSVMVARSLDGTIATYPVVQTIQQDNICKTVIAPAPHITPETTRIADTLAKSAITVFDGAGVFGVEMFLTTKGDLLINEIAPRPHNSGHYTIEACITSQFEQHLRAILGLPLGDTSMKVHSAVMTNLLGVSDLDKSPSAFSATYAPVTRALRIPGATPHWYGKRDVKLNRKMGHITVVGDSLEQVLSRVSDIMQDDSLRNYASVASPQRPLVGIIMGSDSDLPKMKAAADVLKQFGVPFEVTIVSAHRTPDRMVEYGKTAHARGLRVIIAGAGGAAHLPGMVAALTPLPVIGVPVRIEPLDGTDALFSIVQMPRGVPVATVAINNSTNAGLLAARIIGSSDPIILDKMLKYQQNMKEEVLAKVEKLETVGWENYNT